jgi:hypothetical protein
MSNRLSKPRRRSLDRFVRSGWMRGVLAAALIPMMFLWGFGGTTVIAHAHHGHDTHLHVAMSEEAVRLSAEQHHLALTSGGDDCDFNLVFSIPDHELMTSRGINLSATPKLAQIIPIALYWIWAQPCVSEQLGSPGGCPPSALRHLYALTVGQRLVRTSQALLI